MTEEQKNEYRMLVDTSMIDFRRDIQPAGLLRIIESTIEQHLPRIGMDVPTMVRRYNASWAFLSLAVEILDAVEPGEFLTARTWFSGRKAMLFRRELELCHADGSRAVAGSFFSGIIDLGRRKLIRDPAFLGKFLLEPGETLLEADSRMSPELSLYREAGRRKVYPSWVDGLGHVNNARYGDIIYDVLQDDETAPEGKLKRLELYFTGELRRGEEVLLLRRDLPGGCSILGIHEESGGHAFYSNVTFA